MPNRRISLQCLTAEYPYTAQPQSVPAVVNHFVSLQRPTAKYPCSAQLQSIPAIPNRKVSLQYPSTKYPCRAQPKSIPAVPKRRVSLECPTAKYQYSCSAFAVLRGRQLSAGRETLHCLCNNGFRVGMLEVNDLVRIARAACSLQQCIISIAFCEDWLTCPQVASDMKINQRAIRDFWDLLSIM